MSLYFYSLLPASRMICYNGRCIAVLRSQRCHLSSVVDTFLWRLSMTDTMPLQDPPRRNATQKSRKRRSFWRKFSLVTVILLLICAGVLYRYSGYSVPNALRILGLGAGFVTDKALSKPPFDGKQQVNILLLGTDVSFGGSSRTDTIKLISIDFAKERISMMSIPRDTWVTLPNGEEGRINSAHALGGNNRQKCIDMAKNAVETLLTDLNGQPVQIDKYIRVQTDRFVKIVEAMGGIDIDVEKQMDYEDPSQNLFIHLKPGLQHLNGEQAMGYVRFRHDAESDFGRIRRQDAFIRTIAGQINQPGQKERLLKLVGPMLDLVSTDISINDAQGVRALVSKIGMDGIQSVQLPTVATFKGAASVVEIKDRVAASQAVKDLLVGPRPTVLVLNGSKHPGLARTVSESISTDQYRVVGMGTTKTPMPQSTIYATMNRKGDAERLAAQLHLPVVVDTQNPPPAANLATTEESASASPVQITLVLGADFQQTQATVPDTATVTHGN